MAIAHDASDRFQATTREAWRQWLQRHHDSSSGIWFISFKKTADKPRVSYDEAVEEALCFGWIDSKPQKLDAERYMLRFTPRKPGSGWSALNKRRIARLIQEGLMTPPGLAKIEAAKRDGSWSSLDARERLDMSPELKKALAANPKARANFEAFSPGTRKGILWWIHTARRPETRQKRIEETVRLAAKNVRAGHWGDEQRQKAKAAAPPARKRAPTRK